MKNRQTLSGKVEEIIYARLEPGDDLLRALWEICKKHDVKTGILLDATGSMKNCVLQRFPHESHGGAGIDVVDVQGPLEVSAHGIIGMGWVPDESVTPHPAIARKGTTGFGFGGFEGHETPYCHVHVTVTSASETVCGHLMEGSLLNPKPYPDKIDPISKRGNVPEHFSVAIAKVSGVILRATFDKSGYYHDIVPA
ncbi:PCC domain-containing protein [Bradyrhizobium sp. USDA 3315]